MKDIISDIFLDDWHNLKIIWVWLIVLCCIALCIGYITEHLSEDYKAHQDFQAKCISAGGTLNKYDNDKCYKDGELIDSIGEKK